MNRHDPLLVEHATDIACALDDLSLDCRQAIVDSLPPAAYDLFVGHIATIRRAHTALCDRLFGDDTVITFGERKANRRPIDVSNDRKADRFIDDPDFRFAVNTAIEVACPRCDAQPGATCMTVHGRHAARAHSARNYARLEELIAPPAPRPVQCEARNDDTGGRCQRPMNVLVGEMAVCVRHARWAEDQQRDQAPPRGIDRPSLIDVALSKVLDEFDRAHEPVIEF